ncbi:MAG: CocE/NonD family hydrolase [Actinomycetota bacterium]|nr:CocE/NonD family hydrolase [Actinomycetota bacterium]
MKGFSRRAVAVTVALLTAATALSGVPAVAKPARAGKAVPPTDYTKLKGLSQPKYKTIRESHMVPMKDGINMYVEVVRPDVKGRFGTILELSPYHGTLHERSGTRILPGPEDGMAGYFAPRGYAVVFADLRGTGRSEGCLDHMGPKDQSDAFEIVEWAAKQPWSNGRVGMTGHSYVGSTPQMAAAQKPPHLVTMVPSAGLAAMYHHEFQLGVPYYLQWAGPLFAYEQLAIERHLPGGDNFGNGMQYFGCGATQSAAVTGEAYFSGAETDWHRERDFRKGATNAKIPTFIIHGVNDNAARIAASDWFIARNGRPGDKAWIGQWDHGSGCCPNRRGDHWTLALHVWFDKHLQQRNVSTGPAAEIFLNDGSIFTADQWPPKPDAKLKFYPQGDGSMSVDAKETEEETLSFVSDPRGFTNEFNTGSVAFETGPLPEDILIAGVPKMHLVTSVTSPRVHIVAGLYDVKGSTADRIGQSMFAISPELRNGPDKPEPVVPAQVMRIDMDGQPQAHLVKKGHTLRLIVASSHPDKVPVFAGGAQVSVVVGGEDGTTVTVPVVYDPKLWPDPLKQVAAP